MEKEKMEKQEPCQKTDDFEACHYADVKETPHRWLWQPYIPFGMISLVQGMPGSGKSTFLTDIIACATKGAMLPDGTRLEKKVNAVYQCAQAGGPGVIKTMLKNAGADLNAVSFVRGDSLTICDGRIQRLVEETDAKILVVDPMQEFLESNMFQAQSSRKEFSEIATLAEKTGCAVILVSHLTKSENKEELYRGLGSIDIAAAVRSVLHVRRLNSTSPVRYISQIKCNIAPEAGDYAFEIVNLGVARWIGPVAQSDMNEINEEAKSKRGEKQEAAIRDLRELLSAGDIDAMEALRLMRMKGHSQGTVRLIKDAAGAKSLKKSDGKWVWHLSPE